MDVSKTITKASDPVTWTLLCDGADIDNSHVPKHGKGICNAVAFDDKGNKYSAEVEWDYSWGVEWDDCDVEWYLMTPDEVLPCVTCGHVEPKELTVEGKSIAELMQMRYDLQSKFDSDMAPIAEAIAEIESGALQELVEGKPVQGFKLKKGRKTRKVLDEKSLVQAVTDLGMTRSSLYDAKLKGVPALEKLFKQTFTKEVAESLYNENIEETIGNPSIEYTGE